MKNPHFIVILILLSSFVCADELPKKELKAFSARVEDVRLSGVLVEQGKHVDEIVSVKVPAVIFSTPISITDVRKAKKFDIPEIDVLLSYLRANISESAGDMAAFWAPDEQQEMLKDMSDPELFKKNRSYHQEYPGVIIVGLIYQDRTTSLLIKETDPHPVLPALGINFITIHGKLYLTNHPSNDLELAIIEASFK